MTARRGWTVERRSGRAADLLAAELPADAARAVTVLEVETPALVLGSAQRLEAADAERCAAAGVDIVRRGSGGGAVYLEPGPVLWVDVVLPAGDPLWHDDVGRAFHWLGDVWAAAIATAAPAVAGDISVHRGAPVANGWSSSICFAGLGAGEVTVGGLKAVGMSQRRTRAGARFQCAVLLDEPAAGAPAGVGRVVERVVELLALDAEHQCAARSHLAAFATAVPASSPAVVSALVAALP